MATGCDVPSCESSAGFVESVPHAGLAGAQHKVAADGDLGPEMVLDHSPDRRVRTRSTVLGS